MKKTFFLLFLLVSVALLRKDVLAQAGSTTNKPPDPEATCKLHSEVAVKAYCDTLVAFQKSVNDGTTRTVADARPFLNKLDLTKPNAVLDYRVSPHHPK